jgi:apolipoprotein N-acyltransferase
VPPFGWWPLAIVGIGLLSTTFRAEPSGQGRAMRGLLFGLGLYVPSLWWMGQFSVPGAIFVGALESAITAVAFVAIPRRRAELFVPAGLVLADSLRSLWPFGGLPLGGIDLGQAAGPLAPLVGFGGRLLLIGVTACFGVVIAARAPSVRAHTVPSSWIIASGAALVVLVVLAHVVPNGTHANGRQIRLAIVQGGGPRGSRASNNNADRTFEAHLAATRTLTRDDRIDAVLWPENTVETDTLRTSPRTLKLQAEALRLNAPLIVGATEDIDERFAKNEQAVISETGVADVFEKVRRVPYGEYFPFRSVIGKLAELPKRDFRPGDQPGVLNAADTRYAVAISYEGFFDDRTRGGVRAGGEAVLIPTNASSYTTSQVPTQQVAAARLRAIETGRWVAQAGPTGLSVVLKPDGTSTWRSTIGKRQTHIADIELRTGLTPYVRWNDAPVLALLGVAFTTGWLRSRGRFRAIARESAPAQ